MSFSENIRQKRKDKKMTQEALAELLDVSRQAVSKWESGTGFPDFDKLIKLSEVLDVSLDELTDKSITEEKGRYTGEITIISSKENIIMKCSKIICSKRFRTGKDGPKYALFGNNSAKTKGDNVFLGWYKNEDDAGKESEEISKAISKGVPVYYLKYNIKVKRRGLSLKADE